MNDTLVIRKRYVFSALMVLLFAFLSAVALMGLFQAEGLGVKAFQRLRAVAQNRLERIGEQITPVPHLFGTAKKF